MAASSGSLALVLGDESAEKEDEAQSVLMSQEVEGMSLTDEVGVADYPSHAVGDNSLFDPLSPVLVALAAEELQY